MQWRGAPIFRASSHTFVSIVCAICSLAASLVQSELYCPPECSPDSSQTGSWNSRYFRCQLYQFSEVYGMCDFNCSMDIGEAEVVLPNHPRQITINRDDECEQGACLNVPVPFESPPISKPALGMPNECAWNYKRFRIEEPAVPQVFTAAVLRQGMRVEHCSNITALIPTLQLLDCRITDDLTAIPRFKLLYTKLTVGYVRNKMP